MTGVSKKVIVHFYSGYKGEETPQSLIIDSRVFQVEKVLSRKRCQEKDSGRHYELFVCRVAGKTVKIRKDESGECEMSPAAGFLLPPEK